jgi:hypothetical protein
VVSAAAAVMGMGDEFNAEAFRGAALECWRAVKGEIDSPAEKAEREEGGATFQ